MPRPPALAAYLAFSARAEGWASARLAKRLKLGKESPDRLPERKGEASVPRPAGRLIWFHAASVGESLSLLELIRRLGQSDPDLQFLMTTGTVSSAAILAARLPERCLHQFVPIDALPFVRRFLDHWKPDLAVWTESELWPALLTETHARGTPMLLINARMSERSARRWRILRGSGKALLDLFAAVQVQDRATAEALTMLGLPSERLEVTGTLKEGTPPPPCNELHLARLNEKLSGRPVWLAASTHPGEEALVSQAHRTAKAHAHKLLLILAPRHPERGPAIAEALRADGWNVAERSKDQPLQPETDVYLADTLGEMGLWYRLAQISFVGGSLVPIGGHNPYEPATLGSAILYGPHVANFRDIYDRLQKSAAAVAVADSDELGQQVTRLLEPSLSAPMAYAAWELCSAGAEVTDKALALILAHLRAGAA